jgi:hypothetical protein
MSAVITDHDEHHHEPPSAYSVRSWLYTTNHKIRLAAPSFRRDPS